jgi:ureidoacrylate peracid hydrolase
MKGAAHMQSSQTALLIIDVQNDFCSAQGAMAALGRNVGPIQQTMPQLKECIDRCRAAGMMIVFIKTEHGPLTDSHVWQSRAKNAVRICASPWGRAFYEVEPDATDFVVTKHRYSAFIGTNLDLALRANGISTIVLTGFTTNVCVESTARDGFMLGYETITLSDCTAAFSQTEHESALFNLNNYFGRVMSSQELFQDLR